MGKLSIQDIAKVLVAKNGLEQQQANHFATELFAIIQERLEKNDPVKVKGLGTFKVITVEARESVSVRTGGRVMIDEHSKITFTPDATMKELVNKPFSQFETVVLNDNVVFDDMKEQAVDLKRLQKRHRKKLLKSLPIRLRKKLTKGILIGITKDIMIVITKAIAKGIIEDIMSMTMRNWMIMKEEHPVLGSNGFV